MNDPLLSSENHRKSRTALTIMEMVIALAMIAVIFAAMLPQFRNVLNSWDVRRANAETVQNERVLINYLNQNLSKAVKVTAVSDSSVVLGFIEFEDANEDTYRCDVAASKYVQYGQIGSQVDLAGPVSKLQFTCYALDDLDTPITTVDDIRFVKIEATILSAGSMGQDRTVTASAFIHTNGSGGSGGGVLAGSLNSYVIGSSDSIAMCKIDATHYIFADGYEKDHVIYANGDTDTISILTTYDHTGDRRLYPSYHMIDATHVLKASCRGIWPGYACVLTINPDWTLTEEPGFEFDSRGHWSSLAKIDDTHYLCLYRGQQDDGWAQVLAVNPGDWSITSVSSLEFDPVKGEHTSVIKIDDEHYLCAYRANGGIVRAFVMTVDTATFALSAGPIAIAYNYNVFNPGRSDLYMIDSTHYILLGSCGVIASPRIDAVILRVNDFSWTVSAGAPFNITTMGPRDAGLGQFSPTDYVCIYTDPGNKDIFAVDVTVNTSNWSISKGTPIDIDLDDKMSDNPVLSWMYDEYVLCTYSGDVDSFGIIFDNGSGPLLP